MAQLSGIFLLFPETTGQFIGPVVLDESVQVHPFQHEPQAGSSLPPFGFVSGFQGLDRFLDFGFESFLEGRRDSPVGRIVVIYGFNPPKWIANVHPQVELLSVAANEWEGRPSAEILEAVRGYTLLRTDRDGWIELSTDGERLWVEEDGI